MRKKIVIGLLVVLAVVGVGLLIVAGKLGYGPLTESNAVRIYGDDPVRITGTIEGKAIDEGPDRASELHNLLTHATSPGIAKCKMLGTVTLHYASGRTIDMRIGCCTVWIDWKSWDVGDSALRKFFSGR